MGNVPYNMGEESCRIFIMNHSETTFCTGATHRSLQVGRSSRGFQVNVVALTSLCNQLMSVLFLDWSLTERQGNLEVMASVNSLVHPIYFPFHTP